MPQFEAVVTIELKPDILDPAGEATGHVLQQLGYPLEQLRIGRHITLTVQAADVAQAERLVGEMAQNLLANPVMETYQVQVKAG
ncbi:MAG: phosphoribosylformylglycinamidine synthase [Sulfobacillus acidophilus]|uniref:Phosphoribosylformylglycinamidine synthase subunit PurS n=1 Tax=Sulfobacillus acidophilus TaxID=53633 RepID=A0A2T2WG72_9FIRM|nr:MAG: phosphoribosylformylglycinamidine synthase [Sulfobacillus acidophilus]